MPPIFKAKEKLPLKTAVLGKIYTIKEGGERIAKNLILKKVLS